MSKKEPFSRKDCRKARNLAMFWEVRRDGLTQDQVAAKYGVSQQRVSAILRRMALYVALAPSKQYENIPQLGQMQYTYRIWLERMEQRRGDVHRAFKESMKGASSLRRTETKKTMAGEDQKGGYTLSTQVETAKSQHGDWRLDKMLERIDQSISETRLVLYGRNWHGWELLEKEEMTRSGGAKRKKRGKKKSNDELPMSKEDRKSKPEVAVEAAVVDSAAAGVVEPVVAVSVGAASDRVACPTAQARACDAQADAATVAAAVVATPGCPQHALPDGVGHGTPSESPLAAAQVESAIRNPQSAIEPAKRVRPPAISKLTGKRIEAPALKTPEFLREHGLDPADYGGGRSDDPGPIWITGPDPEEVLSRDTSRMNAEEYSQYLKDIAIMKAYGSYREPDRRKPIVMHDKHYYR